MSGAGSPNGWALAGVLTGHVLLGFAWLVVFLSAVFLTSSYTGWADLSLVLGCVSFPVIVMGWQSGSHWYWGVPVAWVTVFAIAALLSVAESVGESSAADAGPPQPGTACPKRSPRAQSGQPQVAGPSQGASLIAFWSDRDGDAQIYVMNADGSDQRRLTRNATQDLYPAWSPDGRQIAFMRRCWHSNDKYDTDQEIFVMNSDGSEQRNLTRRRLWDDESSAWSRDGTKIAFVSGLEYGIFVINADGSGQRVLARNAESLTWSPDGKRIAFVRGLPSEHVAIYVMKNDGSGQKRLTDARVGSFDPAWSPDGSKIAFTSERDENNEIYIMSPDGSGQRRLTHGGGDSAAWSPDGTRIAFASYPDDNSEVYVMNADGSGRTRLTHNSATDADPSWQPTPRRP